MTQIHVPVVSIYVSTNSSLINVLVSVCLTGHFIILNRMTVLVLLRYSSLIAGNFSFIKRIDSASCFITGRHRVENMSKYVYCHAPSFVRSSIILTRIIFPQFLTRFSMFSSPRRLVVSSVVQYVADLSVSADPNRLTAFFSVGDE